MRKASFANIAILFEMMIQLIVVDKEELLYAPTFT